MNTLEIIRRWRLPRFTVTVLALEEPDLDLSWDETGNTQEKLDRGDLVAFCACVRVTLDGHIVLAEEFLGNCIYENYASFMDHAEAAQETRRLRAEGSQAVCGSYAADMVKEAIRCARRKITKIQCVNVRTTEGNE